jgi:hypothetical protein
MKPQRKCLRHGCDRVAVCRELCASDYVVAHRLVREELTTWEELERKGKVGPCKRTAKIWFLS